MKRGRGQPRKLRRHWKQRLVDSDEEDELSQHFASDQSSPLDRRQNPSQQRLHDVQSTTSEETQSNQAETQSDQTKNKKRPVIEATQTTRSLFDSGPSKRPRTNSEQTSKRNSSAVDPTLNTQRRIQFGSSGVNPVEYRDETFDPAEFTTPHNNSAAQILARIRDQDQPAVDFTTSTATQLTPVPQPTLSESVATRVGNMSAQARVLEQTLVDLLEMRSLPISDGVESIQPAQPTRPASYVDQGTQTTPVSEFEDGLNDPTEPKNIDGPSDVEETEPVFNQSHVPPGHFVATPMEFEDILGAFTEVVTQANEIVDVGKKFMSLADCLDELTRLKKGD